ncbi:MAG: GC-type dockerin domain-anchored protein [Planctomycetota bacterium]
MSIRTASLSTCALAALSLAPSAHGQIIAEPREGLYAMEFSTFYFVELDPAFANFEFNSSASQFGPEFEYGDGVFYLADRDSPTPQLKLMDAAGADLGVLPLTFPPGSTNDILTGMEYVNGVLYGAASMAGQGFESTLVTVDLTTGVVTEIGAMEIFWPAGGLAWDGTTMYTVAAGSSIADYYSVDLATGLATYQGTFLDNFEFVDIFLTGLEFHPDGTLYGLGRPEDFPASVILYELDLSTGDANNLGELLPIEFEPTLTSITSIGDIGSSGGPILCPADLTTTGATLMGQPGFAMPDGVVDLDDLGYFIGVWLSNLSEADVTTTGATLAGQPGFGVPDGTVDLDDLGYFISVWLAGCP